MRGLSWRKRAEARTPDDPLVFAGSGSPRFTRRIVDDLGVPLGRSELIRFSEGTLFPRVLENVRGRNVYIVQSTAFPANDNFMELLFWLDAFKRASADSVAAVIPYFAYAKGDKKDEPRVSIRARVCADAIEVAGADRVVTMDLHAPQIQGFFRVPVDDLYAMPYLCEAIAAYGLADPVVVSPDAGFAKKARLFASRLRAPLAIADKMRTGHDEHALVTEVMGDVAGRDAIIVDDFSASAGTLVAAATELTTRGARRVVAAVTHCVLAPGAAAAVAASPIECLFVTDTVETSPEPAHERIQVVSVAPLFAEAIRRIHSRESISSLFDD